MISATANSISVLVVEDEPDLRTLMAVALRLAGFDTATACNAITAIELLSGEPALCPDVVVTDMVMPIGDGLDLCRQLRASALWQAIPVLIVTAFKDDARVRQAALLPDVRVEEKPFRVRDLCAAVLELATQNGKA